MAEAGVEDPSLAILVAPAHALLLLVAVNLHERVGLEALEVAVAVSLVLDLEVLIELKRFSKDAKEKLRLPILEETLRQLKQKGITVGKVKKVRQKTKSNRS